MESSESVCLSVLSLQGTAKKKQQEKLKISLDLLSKKVFFLSGNFSE